MAEKGRVGRSREDATQMKRATTSYHPQKHQAATRRINNNFTLGFQQAKKKKKMPTTLVIFNLICKLKKQKKKKKKKNIDRKNLIRFRIVAYKNIS